MLKYLHNKYNRYNKCEVKSVKKKKDLRIIKTQKILYNTLLELLKEQPFEKIKVSNICQRARINRSTFYSHYNDKYELRN